MRLMFQYQPAVRVRDSSECREVGHTWPSPSRPQLWRWLFSKPEVCERCGTRRHSVPA